MELNKQVCSLELAKKLKELGVKQESLFVWYQSNHSIMKSDVGKTFWYCAHRDNNSTWNTETLSAFTVAELGEMLPDDSYSYHYDHKWRTHFTRMKDCTEEMQGSTEADARAKMLIYLLENNLLTL